MKSRKKVYLRADGNSATGHGHIVRALAFAEKVREHFDTHFLVRQTNEEIISGIRQTCHTVTVLPDFENYADEADHISRSYLKRGDIILLDGYSFELAYQQKITSTGAMLISVDDIQIFPYMSDVVINHAGGISSDLFKIEPYTKLCLGPEFTLLRTEFEKTFGQRSTVQEISSVFVCYGGSDFRNLTCRSLKALLETNLGFRKIDVVTGSSFQFSKELQQILSDNRNADVSVNIHHSLTTLEMISLMEQSQLAIISPSTVSYEASYIGMGIIAVQYVDNQRHIAGFLQDNRCALVLNDGDLFESDFTNALKSIDAEKVNEQILNQRNVFKPSGPNILNIVTKLFEETKLSSRRSVTDDMMLLFEWANDPDVRQNAINKEPIALQSHEKWYKSKLASDTSYIYIIEDPDHQPVGQVRFDMEEPSTFLIDYSIDRKKRGQGLGELLLRKAIKSLCHDFKHKLSLKAKVKKNNMASAQIFRSLSFTFTGIEEINGEEFLSFIK